ncbi:P68 family surface lipoprotein [Mycoplasma hafezii]|uniref:P68 family surface lipoprotein n=1 Tax=Mycoplasma hafezii TaxID=525886 RepID=UPI003CEFC204
MKINWKKLVLGASSLLPVVPFVLLSAGCKPDKGEGEGGGGGEVDDTAAGLTEAHRIANAADGANPSASNSFTLENNAEITLGSTFSENGIQGAALKGLRDAFNDYVDKNKATQPALKKLKLKGLGSGYTQGSDSIRRDLSSKASKTMPNLIINYPPTAATLAAYNMLLSFNSPEPEFNLDITKFSKEFQQQNFEIANVVNNSTYVLPMLKSTNVTAINKPVLYYLLKNLVDNGGKIADDEETKAFYADLEKEGKDDFDGVKTQWGLPVNNIKDLVSEEMSKGEDKSFAVFRKSYFTKYDELLKFSSFMQKLFQNSYNEGKPAEAGVHVFGIDGPPALFGQALFSLANGKMEDTFSYMQIVDGIKKVNFDNLLPGSASVARLNAQKVYEAITAAVKSGGLVLQPGGVYSSTEQKQHKFAFSTGSTAGYAHNFYDKNSTGWIFKNGKVLELNYDIKDNRNIFRTIANTPDKEDKKREGAVAYVGRYDNPLLPAGTQLDPKKDKFAIVFNTQEDEAKFKAVYSKAGDNAIWFDVAQNDTLLKDKALVEKFASSPYFAGNVKIGDGETVYWTFVVKDGVPSPISNETVTPALKTAMESLGFTSEFIDGSRRLQENELGALPTPYFWSDETKVGDVFGQGPSLIGVRGNEDSDNAVRLFVKWIVESGDVKFTYTYNGKTMEYTTTPVKFIEKAFGYIFPVAGYENYDANTLKTLFGSNKYLFTAFDSFKETAKEGSNVKLYEEPADSQSDTFRDQIRAGLDALQKAAASGSEKLPTFEDFTKDLKVKQEQ